ncbi:glycosyltransferase [Enterobacteriaceae bacterium H16N7]|nr:glycosyltransferase [Dryocola clanedunensis]
MSQPLVSVIVTSFNHKKYIEAALDSVYAQTWKNIDVIVVDDASTDGSQKVIRRYQKRRGFTFIERKTNYYDAPVKQGDKPIIEAMNMARGKYIAVVDSDDLILKDKLTRQVALMEQNPTATLCYGDIKLLGADGVIYPYSNYFASGDAFHQLLVSGNFTLYIGSLIRTTAFKSLERSHPDLVQEDWDMFLRLAKLGPFIADEQTVALYRRHDSNTWYRQDKSALMYRNRMMILDNWKNDPLWPQAMGLRWEAYLPGDALTEAEITTLLAERPQDALLHFLTFQYAVRNKERLLACQSLLQAISCCDVRLKILPQLYSMALKLSASPAMTKSLLQDMQRKLPNAASLACYQQAVLKLGKPNDEE